MPPLLASTAQKAGPTVSSPAVAKYSTPSSLARPVLIADLVSTCHCTVPVAASSAYRVPSAQPAYSVPPISTGWPFTEPLSFWDHSVLPLLFRSSASIVVPAGTNRAVLLIVGSAVIAGPGCVCHVVKLLLPSAVHGIADTTP